jgi:hypothetical protein
MTKTLLAQHLVKNSCKFYFIFCWVAAFSANFLGGKIFETRELQNRELGSGDAAQSTQKVKFPAPQKK